MAVDSRVPDGVAVRLFFFGGEGGEQRGAVLPARPQRVGVVDAFSTVGAIDSSVTTRRSCAKLCEHCRLRRW
ncbi:MAG: hypothetical protein CMJ58_25920 [Planctomycetaceae bacterium]|nr:hypothetical protein [Planctomycetaceae bacterium]